MNLDAGPGTGGEALDPSAPVRGLGREDDDIGRPPAVSPRVAGRAVQWLLRLQSAAPGASAEATRRALQEWRGRHPDHERAWQRIEAVNGRLRGMASPLASLVAHAALAPRRSTRRRAALKTLAIALFAGGSAWVAREEAPWREWLADERTGTGERRTVTLPDGTTAALNTRSAIDVRFTASERRVRLLAGEILVTTGRDEGAAARPFVLETAQGELRPLGTRFAVRQYADACRVQVYEGAVAVRRRDGAGREYVLRAGEQLRFTRGAVGDAAPADDADAAWADDMLVAGGMRLDEFLAELGRHRPGRVSCDPAVADLRVSGTYPLADTDRILAALRSTLPVEIRFLTRYWVTVGPASTPTGS